MKTVKWLIPVLVLFMAGNVWALNHDPLIPAPAPVLGAGWAYDQVDAFLTNSSDSPYVYSLADPAVFRITDDFLLGDIYKVYDFGSLILTTANTSEMAPLGGDPSGWLTAGYYKGEILLAAGPHFLTVQSEVGYPPAGFYTRIDSTRVPEPMTMILVGAGLLGLVGFGRRKS